MRARYVIAMRLGIRVSAEDMWLLYEYKWRLSHGYPITSVKGCRHTYLHHAVMGYPLNGLVIDHINRIRTDARRDNLRYATQSENIKNKTKVVFRRRTKHELQVYRLEIIEKYKNKPKRTRKR